MLTYTIPIAISLRLLPMSRVRWWVHALLAVATVAFAVAGTAASVMSIASRITSEDLAPFQCKYT